MAHIDINFDTTPDSVPQIEPGIHTAVIDEIDQEPTKNDDGTNVIVKLKIDGGDSDGRKIKNYINIVSKNKPNEYGHITLKQLARSAGINVGAGGLNLEDLLGKTVKVRIKSTTRKDKETGEIKEGVEVAEYLFS